MSSAIWFFLIKFSTMTIWKFWEYFFFNSTISSTEHQVTHDVTKWRGGEEKEFSLLSLEFFIFSHSSFSRFSGLLSAELKDVRSFLRWNVRHHLNTHKVYIFWSKPKLESFWGIVGCFSSSLCSDVSLVRELTFLWIDSCRSTELRVELNVYSEIRALSECCVREEKLMRGCFLFNRVLINKKKVHPTFSVGVAARSRSDVKFWYIKYSNSLFGHTKFLPLEFSLLKFLV